MSGSSQIAISNSMLCTAALNNLPNLPFINKCNICPMFEFKKFQVHLLQLIIILENLLDPTKMVLLHYKKTDHNQFLVECPGNTQVSEVVDLVVQISNMRIRLDILACSIEDLATHGPLKPEQIRGLSDDKDLIDNALIVAGDQKKKWGVKRQPKGDERYNQDKTKYRIGIIKPENVTNTMIETSNKAKKLISYKNVEMKTLLTLKSLNQVWEELKATMSIAYPNFQGLGQWEPALQICKGQYNWNDLSTNQIDYLDPKNSVIWWAGKQFRPEKKLNDYSGKNEKTKLVIKLTKEGSGAPAREGGVDEDTRTKLMGMYHKKQEELKRLDSNNEEDFTNSVWANPNNLKSYLVSGSKDVKFK